MLSGVYNEESSPSKNESSDRDKGNILEHTKVHPKNGKQSNPNTYSGSTKSYPDKRLHSKIQTTYFSHSLMSSNQSMPKEKLLGQTVARKLFSSSNTFCSQTNKQNIPGPFSSKNKKYKHLKEIVSIHKADREKAATKKESNVSSSWGSDQSTLKDTKEMSKCHNNLKKNFVSIGQKVCLNKSEITTNNTNYCKEEEAPQQDSIPKASSAILPPLHLHMYKIPKIQTTKPSNVSLVSPNNNEEWRLTPTPLTMTKIVSTSLILPSQSVKRPNQTLTEESQTKRKKEKSLTNSNIITTTIPHDANSNSIDLLHPRLDSNVSKNETNFNLCQELMGSKTYVERIPYVTGNKKLKTSISSLNENEKRENKKTSLDESRNALSLKGQQKNSSGESYRRKKHPSKNTGNTKTFKSISQFNAIQHSKDPSKKVWTLPVNRVTSSFKQGKRSVELNSKSDDKAVECLPSNANEPSPLDPRIKNKYNLKDQKNKDNEQVPPENTIENQAQRKQKPNKVSESDQENCLPLNSLLGSDSVAETIISVDKNGSFPEKCEEENLVENPKNGRDRPRKNNQDKIQALASTGRALPQNDEEVVHPSTSSSKSTRGRLRRKSCSNKISTKWNNEDAEFRPYISLPSCKSNRYSFRERRLSSKEYVEYSDYEAFGSNEESESQDRLLKQRRKRKTVEKHERANKNKKMKSKIPAPDHQVCPDFSDMQNDLAFDEDEWESIPIFKPQAKSKAVHLSIVSKSDDEEKEDNDFNSEDRSNNQKSEYSVANVSIASKPSGYTGIENLITASKAPTNFKASNKGIGSDALGNAPLHLICSPNFYKIQDDDPYSFRLSPEIVLPIKQSYLSHPNEKVQPPSETIDSLKINKNSETSEIFIEDEQSPDNSEISKTLDESEPNSEDLDDHNTSDNSCESGIQLCQPAHSAIETKNNKIETNHESTEEDFDLPNETQIDIEHAINIKIEIPDEEDELSTNPIKVWGDILDDEETVQVPYKKENKESQDDTNGVLELVTNLICTRVEEIQESLNDKDEELDDIYEENKQETEDRLVLSVCHDQRSHNKERKDIQEEINEESESSCMDGMDEKNDKESLESENIEKLDQFNAEGKEQSTDSILNSSERDRTPQDEVISQTVLQEDKQPTCPEFVQEVEISSTSEIQKVIMQKSVETLGFLVQKKLSQIQNVQLQVSNEDEKAKTVEEESSDKISSENSTLGENKTNDIESLGKQGEDNTNNTKEKARNFENSKDTLSGLEPEKEFHLEEKDQQGPMDSSMVTPMFNLTETIESFKALELEKIKDTEMVTIELSSLESNVQSDALTFYSSPKEQVESTGNQNPKLIQNQSSIDSVASHWNSSQNSNAILGASRSQSLDSDYRHHPFFNPAISRTSSRVRQIVCSPELESFSQVSITNANSTFSGGPNATRDYIPSSTSTPSCTITSIQASPIELLNLGPLKYVRGNKSQVTTTKITNTPVTNSVTITLMDGATASYDIFPEPSASNPRDVINGESSNPEPPIKTPLQENVPISTPQFPSSVQKESTLPSFYLYNEPISSPESETINQPSPGPNSVEMTTSVQPTASVQPTFFASPFAKFSWKNVLMVEYAHLCICPRCNKLYECPRDASRCLRKHNMRRCWVCYQTWRIGNKDLEMRYCSNHNQKHHRKDFATGEWLCRYCNDKIPFTFELRNHMEVKHFGLPLSHRSIEADELLNIHSSRDFNIRDGGQSIDSSSQLITRKYLRSLQTSFFSEKQDKRTNTGQKRVQSKGTAKITLASESQTLPELQMETLIMSQGQPERVETVTSTSETQSVPLSSTSTFTADSCTNKQLLGESLNLTTINTSLPLGLTMKHNVEKSDSNSIPFDLTMNSRRGSQLYIPPITCSAATNVQTESEWTRTETTNRFINSLFSGNERPKSRFNVGEYRRFDGSIGELPVDMRNPQTKRTRFEESLPLGRKEESWLNRPSRNGTQPDPSPLEIDLTTDTPPPKPSEIPESRVNYTSVIKRVNLIPRLIKEGIQNESIVPINNLKPVLSPFERFKTQKVTINDNQQSDARSDSFVQVSPNLPVSSICHCPSMRYSAIALSKFQSSCDKNNCNFCSGYSAHRKNPGIENAHNQIFSQRERGQTVQVPVPEAYLWRQESHHPNMFKNNPSNQVPSQLQAPYRASQVDPKFTPNMMPPNVISQEILLRSSMGLPFSNQNLTRPPQHSYQNTVHVNGGTISIHRDESTYKATSQQQRLFLPNMSNIQSLPPGRPERNIHRQPNPTNEKQQRVIYQSNDLSISCPIPNCNCNQRNRSNTTLLMGTQVLIDGSRNIISNPIPNLYNNYEQPGINLQRLPPPSYQQYIVSPKVPEDTSKVASSPNIPVISITTPVITNKDNTTNKDNAEIANAYEIASSLTITHIDKINASENIITSSSSALNESFASKTNLQSNANSETGSDISNNPQNIDITLKSILQPQPEVQEEEMTPQPNMSRCAQIRNLVEQYRVTNDFTQHNVRVNLLKTRTLIFKRKDDELITKNPNLEHLAISYRSNNKMDLLYLIREIAFRVFQHWIIDTGNIEDSDRQGWTLFGWSQLGCDESKIPIDINPTNVVFHNFNDKQIFEMVNPIFVNLILKCFYDQCTKNKTKDLGEFLLFIVKTILELAFKNDK